jgi:heme exporter protein D
MTNMWNNFGEFLAMGGYGLFVWGSIGACAVVCAVEPIMLNLKRRALLREAQEQGRVDAGQSAV